jgi:MFS family permease
VIRSILTLLALLSLIAMPYTVLMPIVAGQVLHGGAHTLGFLMGASGVGALISAVTLVLRKSVLGLGRMIALSAGLFGGGLMLLSTSRILWLSLALMVVTGFGMMQQLAASNTILQTIVADDKRGRVMAFYTLAVLGVTPIGSLCAGLAAASMGAPATLFCGGVCCIGGAIWFARRLPELRRVIRPRYRELGILPQLATGVQSASALQVPPEV